MVMMFSDFFIIFEQNVIVSNKHGVQVASRVSTRLKKKDLRKVGNIKKISKIHRIIA